MPLLRRLKTSSCCWKRPALAAGTLKLPVVLGGTVRLGGLTEGVVVEVGEGGALHLLHAVVPTPVMDFHSSNSACVHLYIIRHESELKLALPSSLAKKMKQ